MKTTQPTEIMPTKSNFVDLWQKSIKRLSCGTAADQSLKSKWHASID